MHYLVDGYNFLFRIPQKRATPLEKRREGLIERLSALLLPFKGEVTLIFDSAEEDRPYAQTAHLPHLNIIYSPKGQSADGYIIELASIIKHPKTTTVVSSDAGLIREVKYLGVHTLSIEGFIDLIARKRGSSSSTEKIPSSPSNRDLERLLAIFENKLKEDHL